MLRRATSIFLRLVTVFALAFSFSQSMYGQGQLGPYSDTNSTPLAGVGRDYISNLAETVDPQTGGLSIRVSAPAPAERALNLPQYAYIYDSNGQFGITPHWAYSGYTHSQYVSNVTLDNNITVYKPNSVTFSTYIGDTTVGTGFQVSCTYWTDYIYTDPNGGRHPLTGFTAISNTNAQLGCPAIGISGTSAGQSYSDGTYTAIFTGSGTSVIVFDNHGNLLAGTDSSGAVAEDTSGNYQNGTGRTYGNTAVSTTSPSMGGPYATLTVPGLATPSGFSAPYTFVPTVGSRGTTTAAFPNGSIASRPSQDASCPTTFSGTYGGYVGSATLTLPDGTAYSFTLDPATGLINQITYPTGVIVYYTWTVQSKFAYSNFYLPASSPSNPCAYTYDWPAITSRVVKVNNVQVSRQDYTYVTSGSAGTPWTQRQTTVKTTDFVTTGLPSYQTVYTFTNPMYPPETDTVAASDIGGSLIKTDLKIFNSLTQLAAECTTYPSGTTGGTFYKYGTGGPVTDEATYDFGTVTSSCQQPSSAALREVATAYHSFPASTSAPNTPMSGATVVIKDRPDSVKIYGGGTRLAETDYIYDGVAAQAVSGVLIAHDDANYGPGSAYPRGNPTTITRQCFIINGPSCANSATQVTYDVTGQTTAVKDANGQSTYYSFADRYTSDNGSPAANKATNTYVTAVTYPQTGSVSHTESFEYGFNDGKLRLSTDQNSRIRSFCYLTNGCQGSVFDPWFRLTGTTMPDGGGQTTTYTTTAGIQTVVTSTLASPSPAVVSQTTIDQMGRTSSSAMTSAPGGTITTGYNYDGFGNLHSQSNPSQCSTGSSCAETTAGSTTFTYDSLGRITKKTYPDGNADTTAYQENGTLVSDAVPNLWRYYYDFLGRLTSVIEQANKTLLGHTNCTPTCVFDRYGTLTNYQYDGLSNLTSVSQAGYTGDTARTRSFSYDSLSRLFTSTNPETGTICYGTTAASPATVANCTPGYDPNGNLLYKTDASGMTIGYTYDQLNRLTSKVANDGGPYNKNTNFSMIYDYGTDGVGRLFQEYDPSYSGTQFTYDVMGRVAGTTVLYYRAQTPVWGTGMRVKYDLSGNTTQLTYPDQRVVKKSWDGTGRLASIWDATGGSAGTVYFSGSQNFSNPCGSTTPATNCAAYSPNGQLLHSGYGNGVNLDFTANSRLEPCHMVAGSSALPAIQGIGNLFDRSLSYVSSGNAMSLCGSETGNNGNISAVVDNRQTGMTQAFKYDTANRLTYAARSDGGYNHNYNYDGFGNMLLQDNLHTSPNYSIDTSTNRLLLNSSDFQYDANGRLASSPGNTFLYTAEGNLRSINAYQTGSYLYDSFGERTYWGSANQLIVWREPVYLNSEYLADVDNNGVWTDYVSANGQKIAKLNAADSPLHLSGVNCSNCGGLSSYVSLASGAGYTIQKGDSLRFSQYAANNAEGGLIITFTDGSRAGGGNSYDSAGQQINCNSVKNTWQNRVVDMSAFAGETIAATFAINDVCAGSGQFDIYWNDIAIVGSSGNVVTILNPQRGQTFTPIQSTAWPGKATNLRAVAETNTFATLPAVHYFVADHLSTTQMEIGSGGWPLWQGGFTPFGQEVIGGATNTQIAAQPADGTNMRFKFTGKERDSESGLDYFGARYYGSSMGRFMSPDPSGLYYADPTNPQSLNLYSYALNNPLRFTDPNGLYCFYGDPNNGNDNMDSSQFDFHSSQSECTAPDENGNSGQWINDGATHYTPDGYVDNDGRPDSYVINTSVNSGPSTNMIQTGVSDEVSVLTTIGGALADITIGLSNELGMVTGGKQLPYFRLFGTHYCGPGGGGSPNGGLDPACKAHDDCYAAAGLSAASNGAGASLTLDQAAAAQGCNQALYDAARGHPNQLNGSAPLRQWLTYGDQVPFGHLAPGTEAKAW